MKDKIVGPNGVPCKMVHCSLCSYIVVRYTDTSTCTCSNTKAHLNVLYLTSAGILYLKLLQGYYQPFCADLGL